MGGLRNSLTKTGKFEKCTGCSGSWTAPPLMNQIFIYLKSVYKGSPLQSIQKTLVMLPQFCKNQPKKVLKILKNRLSKFCPMWNFCAHGIS